MSEHPARAAALASRAAVEAKDKAAWLALWAEDGVIQDPVGVSPLDPTGLGHRGAAAREAFWESNIAGTGITFDIRDSHAAGDECANVVSLSLDLGGGASAVCDCVIVYKVDGDGKLLSLRAFWEYERMMATLTTS
ncbi:MAG: nuclear transport factor 2 family protein [Mycobacteriales bacterium]|nr:nuclear transport factor 2 family protein [Mycobacteriales bacterium]